MKNRKRGFFIHLSIFLVYHVSVFWLVQMDFKMTNIFQTYMMWIKEERSVFLIGKLVFM